MSFGSLLLILSLAAILSSLALSVANRNIILRRRLFFSSFAFLIASLLYLTAGLLLGNYSLSYIYLHSSNSLEPLYKLCALWSGQEGSLLLWAVFVFTISIAALKTDNRITIIILSLIMSAFILTILFAANPFIKESVFHNDGVGINPVLKSFWMAVHPPLLYAGYSFAAIPYILALRYLLNRDSSFDYKTSQTYALMSAGFLTMGIATGSVWAYGTLGWGGFWNWDPVENSSLIPWLINVALINALNRKRNNNRADTTILILSLAGFITVILSSFMTRSGIFAAQSVHSFMPSSLAVPFLIFTALLIVLPLATTVFTKLHTEQLNGLNENSGEQQPCSNISKTTSINQLSLSIFIPCFIAATMLLATIIPAAISESGKSAIINPEFFSNMSLLFSIMILFAMAAKHMQKLSNRLKIAGLVAAMPIALYIIITLPPNIRFIIFSLSASAAAAALAMNLFSRLSAIKPAAAFVHAGFIIFAVGVVISTYSSDTYETWIDRGGSVQIEKFNINFSETASQKQSLLLTLSNGSQSETVAIPFTLRSGTFESLNTLIKHYLSHDLYIVAERYISPQSLNGSKTADTNMHKQGKLLLNITFKKLIIMVWIGFFLVSFGFMLDAFSYRGFRAWI